MELGLQIRQARLVRGLSQERLAQLAGVTFKTINRIETGRTSATFRTLEKVAAAMELKVIDFLRSDDDAAIGYCPQPYPDLRFRVAN